MDRWTREELMAADREADEKDLSAAELGEEIAAEAQEERAGNEENEAAELQRRASEGIGELYEDGWTPQELRALVTDEKVQEMFAAGKSVARAACAYLRAKTAQNRKRGVPTAKAIAAGERAQETAIDAMTDEEFDAFSRRAQRAMMSGKKVRM